ncbi:MAG: YifB family Mg chelatase-like AAA ATPase [Clostridiaceae bacterium]|nr:YifB family Mg chelatase-like AAA ATPase [Clostridiaceae bacterium]
MLAAVNSLGLLGVRGFFVRVECYIGPGAPCFEVVGLPDAAVREARERVRASIRFLGYDFPDGRITVNLAPAAVRKEGSVYDLPLLLSILAAAGEIPPLPESAAFIGELSLDAQIRSAAGMLPMSLAAAQNGLATLYCPSKNAVEATLSEHLSVFPVDTVGDLLAHLSGRASLTPAPPWDGRPDPSAPHYDFADVKGQFLAKRAMMIAAAGGHHLLLTGPPGTGKSMLASRISSILPPLTRDEAIETTVIHSVAGILSPEYPLVTERPFRAPHHSISVGGLAGGGRIPRPGELSLAHNGVLFLDELPEFASDALEVLRQPIETGEITISRVNGTLTYPCRFMLVAAMNPCKCGYYGSRVRPCRCSEESVRRYRDRISGPLLDRIDLHLSLPPVSFADLHDDTPPEHSDAIAERVRAARGRQTERFRTYPGTYCNAQMTPAMVREFCRLSPAVSGYLEAAFNRLHLSGRAHDRILRVSRTIADFEQRGDILEEDINNALKYREEF